MSLSAFPKAAQTTISDLWIEIPESPDVDEEAQRCPIILAPGRVTPLSEQMPADDWVRSYVANKLRGHVFYDADHGRREQVAEVATEVLVQDYGIELTSLARELAIK